MVKIVNGFNAQSDAELEANSQEIFQKLTGNSQFPAPVPSLAQFSTELTEFVQSSAAARKGSSLEKTIRDEKRAVLIDTLHLLSNYVAFQAAGSRSAIESSGFAVAKDPTPRVLTKPENIRLSEGANSGELRLDFDRVQAAKSYLYQVTANPLTDASAWQSFTGTTRSFVFTNLTPGQKYWVRVVAVGSGGASITSDAVSRMVL